MSCGRHVGGRWTGCVDDEPTPGTSEAFIMDSGRLVSHYLWAEGDIMAQLTELVLVGEHSRKHYCPSARPFTMSQENIKNRCGIMFHIPADSSALMTLPSRCQTSTYLPSKWCHGRFIRWYCVKISLDSLGSLCSSMLTSSHRSAQRSALGDHLKRTVC